MNSMSHVWLFNSEPIVIQFPQIPQQFNQMKDHGTRIIIYNLWEDDQGQLELDFDADPYVCLGCHYILVWTILFHLRQLSD